MDEHPTTKLARELTLQYPGGCNSNSDVHASVMLARRLLALEAVVDAAREIHDDGNGSRWLGEALAALDKLKEGR